MSKANGQAQEALVERLVAREVEQEALGAVLFRHFPAERFVEQLGAECFWSEPHRWLFEALAETAHSVSVAAVRERLRVRNRLTPEVDRMLAALAPVPPAHNVEALIGTIRGRFALRGLHDAARDAIQLLGSSDLDDLTGLADAVEAKLSSATAPLRRNEGPYRGPHDAERLARMVLDSMSGASQTEVFATSWPSLDEYAKPPVGTPTVIGADTSVGKSALALSLSELWADEGEHVAYHVHEDTAEAMHYRQLSMRSGAAFEKVVAAVHRNDDSPALRKCIAAWEEYLTQRPGRVLFDDSPGVTVETLRMSGRAYRREGYDRFVYDHLLEIRPPGFLRSHERHHQVAYVAQSLRDLIKELNVVGVMLSQVNRASAQNDRPSMHDFMYSGVIEQVARMAVVLRRPHGEDAGDRWHAMQLWVVKATNMRRTRKDEPVNLVFEPARTWVREPRPHERYLLATEGPLYQHLRAQAAEYSPGALQWPHGHEQARSEMRA